MKSNTPPNTWKISLNIVTLQVYPLHIYSWFLSQFTNHIVTEWIFGLLSLLKNCKVNFLNWHYSYLSSPYCWDRSHIIFLYVSFYFLSWNLFIPDLFYSSYVQFAYEYHLISNKYKYWSLSKPNYWSPQPITNLNINEHNGCPGNH